ncbi:hypothetical protein Poli38472_001510 [Pythium oligandrum]|uniref:rRNA-processing protein FYV7 n=1 Tax=Pythium oligandrum TaxID=41045 RepID=A0A8K1CTN6_PYTOL|nr:hypothetical protein Poli38472_001510 [Pythium oligandrum]|eukprot:TMW69354.1 hypothetical protein Poli38472_001510 [Pythium oligandrum]
MVRPDTKSAVNMKGSGLSLERFIQGKAQRTKSEAKSKKRAIIHKAQRKRQYEKVKKKEQQAGDKEQESGPTSFYDRFFSELKNEGDEKPSKKNRHMEVKPDPFFKAKKKAEVKKVEKERVVSEKRKRQEEIEQKVNDRKKRHVKLSVRTSTGQPLVRNHIKDILAKLEAEKKGN